MEKRAAGILMHITSLPSTFGIGDVGPGAYSFADFLYHAKQTYWQILPLTCLEKNQEYSPYSATSSMAGNHWLISPELLINEGLIHKKDLKQFQLNQTNHVNYDEAIAAKHHILKKAYYHFNVKKQEPFEAFCHREAYWLDDYALYTTLKEHFNGNPWYKWPEPYKLRDLKTLMSFAQKHETHLVETKWLQYIFFDQWKRLKAYCHDLNIRIVGDLPFYISHDSVDVWSRPELFSLKKDGSIAGVAGVPPDYFNEHGQLWGMPVYHWDRMKEQRYDWWLKRIRKNLEMTDVLRLDHFRAFSEYWEVPSSEKTAIRGEWKPGPGASFFEVLQQEFGNLPFIAEDLGDISAAVYSLRDQFKLPGMKVLQFAFGDSLPASDHAPHNFTGNFVVYTGTHDNNTTRGWYKNELQPQHQKLVQEYTGIAVAENNIHRALARIAYSSVAQIAILPVQDILGLDDKARMNTPASTKNNWQWRLMPGQLSSREEKWLKEWTDLFARTGTLPTYKG